MGDFNYWIITGPQTRFNSAGRLSGICTVDQSDNEQEDIANTRLIAAAPDLLAALKLFVTQYEGGADRECRPEMAAARAAIAKATGSL